jgi:hypothetical protein
MRYHSIILLAIYLTLIYYYILDYYANDIFRLLYSSRNAN